MHPIGLAARTVPGAAPGQLVALAAAAGFSHVGLALDAVEWTPAVIASTRRAAQDAGVEVLDVEPFRIRDGVLPTSLERDLDVAAALGARFVLVIGHDAPGPRTAQLFRSLCEQAASRGLDAALEFMPFRGVATLADAAQVLAEAGHRRGCLLVDNHHLARSGGVPADLAALPPGRIGYAQLCDVSLPLVPHLAPEAIMQEALERRTLPGEGGLPCREFIAALPPGLPVSVEMLGTHLRQRFASDREYVAALRAAALAVTEFRP